MHRRDNLFKQETPKHRKNTPSFSSTLLDEIYRSFDDAGNPEPHHVRTSRDNKITSPRPCSHIDKWMEKGIIITSKPVRKSSILPEWEIQECDSSSALFSSNSNSNSSFSDSSGALSNSDTEFAQTKLCNNATCFTAQSKPKPVRTTREKIRIDDDPPNKSRSTALKFYAGLKKMKQPISPGGKLTSFINSLFASNKSKKHQVLKENSQSEPPLLISSSIARSCLTRSTRDHHQKQRTVRFHPVGVIVDQDSKPCGHKNIHMNEDYCGSNKRPPLPPKMRASASYHKKNEMLSRKIRLWKDQEDEDEEDAASESSSDLFEIDHLGLFGSTRFSEQLPVYESTYFDRKNCGLVR